MSRIKYCLVPNSFNEPGQVRYTGKIRKEGTLRQDDLIEAMLEKRTTLSDHVIRGVMQLMGETVEERILDGYSVYTDLFRIDASIEGRFESTEERFDPKKHRINVKFKPALDFQKGIRRKAKFKKVSSNYGIEELTPDRIYRFKDKAYATRFQPGDVIELSGYGLKGEGEETFLGFYDGAEMYTLEILRLHNRSILCQIPPDIPLGSYELKIIRNDKLGSTGLLHGNYEIV